MDKGTGRREGEGDGESRREMLKDEDDEEGVHTTRMKGQVGRRERLVGELEGRG